jgi:3-oxoadipate enol-lactonase
LKESRSFAQVGDIRIRYELADLTDPWRGDEPETILLYPGYCRTSEFWRRWVLLLGDEYRVLRLDPRGYGETSKPAPGSAITPEMLVADAIGLMDALGLTRVHWVGEVTGGTLGLLAALTHPARIASVTLSNSYAKMSDETPRTYALGEDDQEAAIRRFGVEEWCRRTLPHRMDVSRAPPGLVAWVACEMAKTPVHVAASAFRIFSNVDLTARLGEVSVPVMLLVGSKCAERLKRHAKEMCERLPRARIVEIEGYDYGIHLLAPEATAGAVRRFLSEIRA